MAISHSIFLGYLFDSSIWLFPQSSFVHYFNPMESLSLLFEVICTGPTKNNSDPDQT